MLKKLISYTICVCVMLGMLICPADAAAPIVYDGNEITHFDQSFSGGTSAASFSDFDITNGSGTWLYAPDYIMETKGGGKVMTKNTYDLTDVDSAEFKVTTITTNNGYKLYMGDYVLSVNRNFTVLFNGPIKYTPTWGIDYDHENCLAYTNNENGATPVTGTSYGGVVNATIRIEKRKISISTDVADRTGTLVYNVEDGKPDIAINGKFGIEGGTNENFTLFSMSLKSGQTAVVNDWYFEHTFSAADTVESLAEQGLYFDAAQYSFDATKGLAVTTNNAAYEFVPGNTPLTSDYTFEVKTWKDGGTQYVRFNVNGGNYYELAVSTLANANAGGNYTGGSKLALYKVKNWSATELWAVETAPLDAADTTDCIPATYSDYTFKVTQATTEAGKTIDVTVSAIRDKEPYSYTMPTYTDTEPLTSASSVTVANAAWADTKCPVYYVKAWSAPSGEDIVSDVTLIDKTITAADTQASAANDYNIISPGGLVNLGDRYGLDGVEAHKETVYDKVLSGSYTVTTDTRVGYNAYWYYINYADENNYYKINFEKTGGVTVTKKKNGAETEMTVVADAGNGTEYSNGYTTETTETKVELGDSSLSLNITRTAGGKTLKYTATDSQDPITSGKYKIGWGSNGERAFYSIKVVRHSRPSGVVEGVFKVNNAETYAYAKGVIKFAMPTAVIGKYKVIAALYEDNAMTDVRVLNEFDVYRGEVTLFDTTSSEAQNGSVKVFLVDTTDTLNKITDVWELK